LKVLFGAISRNEYFAGLFAIACANGLGSRMIEMVRESGWTAAILSTFEISAVVWLSCAAGLAMVVRERDGEIQRLDLVVGAVLLVLIVLPIGGLSWLAVTLLSLYAAAFADPPSPLRRGAMILLAVTVPMLWSRLLFRFFANFILQIDASLVSLMLGTSRSGNLVRFVDGSGTLAIVPYCSSLHNVSLAVLTWVAINQWLGRRWSSSDWQWIVLAGVAVVAVNVTRMSLMALSATHYHAIHGSWGDIVTNLLTLCAVVGLCLMGVRRELFASP
jgi:hypothetical protein